MKTASFLFKASSVLLLLMLGIAVTRQPETSAAQLAQVWYVSPSGNDANSCLTPTETCATIQATLNKANAGDMILVTAGEYPADQARGISITKAITLSGGWNASFTRQDGMTILNGNPPPPHATGITIKVNINNSEVRIDHFSIENFSAEGIYHLGSLTGETTINHCVIRRNSGGGIYNSGGKITINNSAILDNIVTGGIYSYSGMLVINNSTISGNQASHGGGISSYHATVWINNSTITQNRAFQSSGGGIATGFGSTTTIRNSILANNDAYGSGKDCAGDINSAGYNIFGDPSGCNLSLSTGDRTNVNPLLGVLQGNPPYYPLLAGSPAINAGNPSGCTNHLDEPLATDQRGMPRVSTCDIGAYERSLVASKQVSGDFNAGGLITYTVVLYHEEGNTTLHNVMLTDTLPVELRYNPGTLTATNGTATESAGTITWQGNISQTTTTNITFQAFITDTFPIATSVTNIAHISWDDHDFTISAVFDNAYKVYLPLVVKHYPELDPNCPVVYQDDFSNPNSGWSVGEDSYVSASYFNGEYRVVSKQGGLLYLFSSPNCPHNSYVVEADMRWVGTPGNSYGLIFGINSDYTEYVMFDINTDHQLYRMYHRTPAGFVEVTPPTYSSLILTGNATNHLRVDQGYGWLGLSINGTSLGSTIPTPGFNGYSNTVRAGVISSASSAVPITDARFDNFTIAAMPSASRSMMLASTHTLQSCWVATDSTTQTLLPVHDAIPPWFE